VLKIKISRMTMGRRRNTSCSDVLTRAFQGHRPNTIRLYTSRLEILANRLGMEEEEDIPCSGRDILSPWWLADPDHVMDVLQQQEFATSTIRSYLTAITALLNRVSSTGDLEGDRTAARLLEGIYRSKHAALRL
jgi:hypothetical protein